MIKQLTLKKITQNKQAYHTFFIQKKIEAGISLLGWEVKSIRSNTITIKNSYISFKNKEAYICNAIFQLNTQQQHNYENYHPTRMRKLLLKKNELLFLMEQIKQKGYTAIILELYWSNNWVKILIGLAKGKKKYDKRQTIQSNQWNSEKIHITRMIK